MRYGIQDDPSQDNSQFAPRQRPNALAANALQGALNEDSSWGTNGGPPQPTAIPPIGATRSAQSFGPRIKDDITAASRLGRTPVPDNGGSRMLRAPKSALDRAKIDFPGFASDEPDTDEKESGGGVDLGLPPPDVSTASPVPLTTAPLDDRDLTDPDPKESTGPWSPPMGSLDPASSKMAPRILVENGKTYLTEHGNRRELQPAEIAAFQGYVTDYWNKFPTGFQEGVGPQTNEEYVDPVKQTGLEGIDSSKWDTDQWPAPKYVTRSPGGVLEGWSNENWNNPDMQTPKYVAGRIFSQYDPNDPASVEAMVKEIQQAYPGATFDGKDKLTIPGLGIIDVIIGAGAPGARWGWNDLTNGPQNSASGGGSSFTANQQMGGDTTSIIAQILPILMRELGLGTPK